ncbi:hypothetical protein HY995_03575 [Candidatus Micrarchaeota archaeon]|nr:hypothetical protein [Candidatus Micrarchaeota archaeon]
MQELARNLHQLKGVRVDLENAALGHENAKSRLDISYVTIRPRFALALAAPSLRAAEKLLRMEGFHSLPGVRFVRQPGSIELSSVAGEDESGKFRELLLAFQKLGLRQKTIPRSIF